jgi:peroxiredoxin
MKNLLTFLILGFFTLTVFSQEIPQVQIKDLEGRTVNTKTITSNNGKPVLVSFFATWCKPCVQELTALSEEYDDLKSETGVKIIAISTDNARSTSSVGPFVNARGWEFDVYLDPNGDFKRAMNVTNVPHTFLLDKTGKVVWQHTSYLQGDEAETFEVIRKVAKGQSLK